jgi:hypothetical protein
VPCTLTPHVTVPGGATDAEGDAVLGVGRRTWVLTMAAGGNNELDEEVEDVFEVGVEGMSSNMTLRRTLRGTCMS